MELPLFPVAILAVPSQESSSRNLTGVVLDEDGGAISGGLVLARSDGRRGAFEKPAVARTDSEGRFRLELGSGDSFSVSAFAPGFALSSKEKVSAGDVLRFELGPGLSVSGVIRDARTREPLPRPRLESSALPWGAQPAPFLPGLGKSAAESDGRGRFRLKGLPPGPVYVSASARGYGRVDLRAQGGEEELAVIDPTETP